MKQDALTTIGEPEVQPRTSVWQPYRVLGFWPLVPLIQSHRKIAKVGTGGSDRTGEFAYHGGRDSEGSTSEEVQA